MPLANWRASRELVALLIRHRHLAWVLARREVADRYAGQFFGILWGFCHPLLQVAVFVFVFAVVFKVRLGSGDLGPDDYTVYLLAGLVPWLTVQESISRSTTSITSQSSLVKQVVFPTEVLPVKIVLAAMGTQIVFLAAVLIYRLAAGHGLPWTFALVPLLLIVEAIGLIGLAMILGSIGVFFRDLKDLVQVITLLGLYLVPVAYQPSMVPEAIRPFLWANPFSYLIWCFQDAIYYGSFEHPWAWPVLCFLSLFTFALGARLFQNLKPIFGGVL